MKDEKASAAVIVNHSIQNILDREKVPLAKPEPARRPCYNSKPNTPSQTDGQDRLQVNQSCKLSRPPSQKALLFIAGTGNMYLGINFW